MKFRLFLTLSIKTRVTLFTLAIFLLSLWSLAFYASRTLRADMRRLLSDQQFSTATFVAADVNDELVNRFTTLESVAAGISPATMGNAAALQTMLEDRPLLVSLFNAGVTVVAPDGTALADVPRSNGRIGVNYIKIDYVAANLKEGKAMIGKPIIGPTLKAPVFGMGVPIRDTHGNVIGALSGVTNVGKPNFLDMIEKATYGKTGGFFLAAPQYRLIVTASDKRRIMEEFPAPGVDPVIDARVGGKEGTELFVNPRGVQVLSSAKNVPVVGWFVVVSLPSEEAFAPIRDVEQRLLLATLFVTLLAAALTWWMMQRQLAPMQQTVKTLVAASESDRHPPPLPVTGQDELGQLIGGFNHLLIELGQRGDALRESEARYSTLIQNIGEGICFVDIGEQFTFANPAAEGIFGVPPGGLLGYSLREFTTPEQYSLIEEQTRRRQAGETSTYEHDIYRVDGQIRRLLVTAVPKFDDQGQFTGAFAVFRDITERKQMEEQVRQLAFYDPLTELPNRRLLLDRLSQTLTESKRSGRYGALMFLDLDNFKALNDTAGHAVGDLLLLQAAKRMKSCVRAVDTVARFGGDEFVVMVGGLDADKAAATEQAASIAEKIRLALNAPYQLTVAHDAQADTTVEHQCSASIGVALFTQREGSQDDFLKWADAAMYQAKEAGGNLIRFHAGNASVSA